MLLLGIENDDLNLYIQNRYGAFLSIFFLSFHIKSKFLLHVGHFYRIRYPFHDDVLIVKKYAICAFLKCYYCL